jgi:hypothetical protein
VAARLPDDSGSDGMESIRRVECLQSDRSVMMQSKNTIYLGGTSARRKMQSERLIGRKTTECVMTACRGDKSAGL